MYAAVVLGKYENANYDEIYQVALNAREGY
jgi:hypothetical protein